MASEADKDKRGQEAPGQIPALMPRNGAAADKKDDGANDEAKSLAPEFTSVSVQESKHPAASVSFGARSHSSIVTEDMVRSERDGDASDSYDSVYTYQSYGSEYEDDTGEVRRHLKRVRREAALQDEAPKGDIFSKEKAYLREFVLYICFLCVFTAVTLQSRPGSKSYFLTEAMQDFFVNEEFSNEDAPNRYKSFPDVATHEEFFQWAKGPFLGNMFNTEDINGDPLSDEEQRYVFGQNRLLGSIRLRLIRVGGDTCQVESRFSDLFTECFGKYGKSSEDRAAFKVGNETLTYQTADELDELWTWGKLHKYRGGGFVVDLPPNYDAALEKVQYLEDNRFLDRASRALFLTFSVYNANTNLFSVVQMMFEMPGTGSVVPNIQIRTLRLFRYLFVTDYVLGVFELIFVIFVFYYIFQEIIEFVREGKSYLKDGWNYYDWANLLLFVTVIMMRAVAVSQIYAKDWDLSTSDYLNLQTVAVIQQQEINTNSANAFLCWFKVFKYLSISKRLSLVSRTIAHAGIDLATYLVMFGIVFCGFGHMGYLVFGDSMPGFRNFGNSVLTLFQALVGSIDFQGMDDANRFLGPIFYITFMVLVFLIMMNMFLAIVNAAYIAVLVENAEMSYTRYNFRGYFKTVVNKVRRRLGLKATDIEIVDRDGDGVELSEVQDQLGNDGAQAFTKFDKDNDGILDETELRAFKAHQASLRDEKAEAEEDRKRAARDQGDDKMAAEGALAVRNRLMRVNANKTGEMSAEETKEYALKALEALGLNDAEDRINVLDSTVHTLTKAVQGIKVKVDKLAMSSAGGL